MNGFCDLNLKNPLIFGYYSIYKQFKFHAQLSRFITSGSGTRESIFFFLLASETAESTVKSLNFTVSKMLM